MFENRLGVSRVLHLQAGIREETLFTLHVAREEGLGIPFFSETGSKEAN